MNLTPIHNFLRSLMMPLLEIDRALPENGKIYDFGCGEGVVSRFLAKNSKRNIIGVDINGKRLDKNISKNLRPGGILVIKEIDTGENLRSKLSRFWDFVFYPKEKIYFTSAKELSSKLENLGFSVIIKRLAYFFPGSTTLFICKKC